MARIAKGQFAPGDLVGFRTENHGFVFYGLVLEHGYWEVNNHRYRILVMNEKLSGLT